MKIQSALTGVGQNFARPTKFNVMVNPPQDTSGPIMDILCKSISLPEVTNEPIGITYKGHEIKVPGRTNQTQSISLTFYVDEYYNIRDIFENWMNKTDEHYYAHPGYRETAPKLGSIRLTPTNFDETSLFTYFVEGCYPTSIGDLEYSATDKDTVMELTVTFAFYRFIKV